MNQKDQIDQTPSLTGQPFSGPGSRLRQTRLDLKLAPEDVAGMLRLSARQIIALENDDYANLPGPTYVRGYLRSYAQLLGLAPEKIIDLFNKATAASVSPAPVTPVAPEPAQQPAPGSDYRLQMIGVAIAALLAVVIMLWWQSSEPPATSASRTGAHEPMTYQTESGAIIAKPQSPVVAPIIPPTAESPAQVVAPAAVPPAIKETAPVMTPPLVAGESKPVVIAQATPAPGAEKPAVSAVLSRLVLRVEQESWVEVRDARQQRLMYENVAAGRTVTLEGVAPLNVFLGNTDGVRIEYNGQPYDASPHKRGPIARFSLGETAAGAN